jgi:sensor histidine kinase YesM
VHLNQQVRDPEKEISGIGLTNIQERLQLLYNRKHQFSYKSDAKEFVVQLTLQP